MSPIVSIQHVSKSYPNGFQALNKVNLDIQKGEIIALLGPNGAGKTTLISIICGIVNLSQGKVTVNNYDIVKDYRETRAMIGLVPQELTTDAFETVWSTVNFSRGLFGKAPNPAYIEKVLKDLSLWDKKDNMMMTLSGGMKRRVLIAKALSHEPEILFLDEPTAGVDVALRKDMWEVIKQLREQGVTIILTTHYIEEAEEIADRIGIMNRGELMLVQPKEELMHTLGQKQLTLQLTNPITTIPKDLEHYHLVLSEDQQQLTYIFDSQSEQTGVTDLLEDLKKSAIDVADLDTTQRSLEDIFVSLIEEKN